MAGVQQNKHSMKGSDDKSGGKGEPRKVSSIEHVGSSGSHGVRFKMPKEVVDHSCVREMKE